MTCLLALILILRGGSEKLWLIFSFSAGLGLLLNKPSMTFFLVALLAALLVTKQRSLLAGKCSRSCLTHPHRASSLLWQIHNPVTLEFLHNGQVQNKNIKLAPLPDPADHESATCDGHLGRRTGLVVAQSTSLRWLDAYLFFLAGMMALHAKDYYVAPIYPILFAAGGIAGGATPRASNCRGPHLRLSDP